MNLNLFTSSVVFWHNNDRSIDYEIVVSIIIIIELYPRTLHIFVFGPDLDLYKIIPIKKLNCLVYVNIKYFNQKLLIN